MAFIRLQLHLILWKVCTTRPLAAINTRSLGRLSVVPLSQLIYKIKKNKKKKLYELSAVV